MAAEQFDRGRVKFIGRRKRIVTYTTENDIWFVRCDIRQLPGGLFRSGEVCRSFIVDDGWYGKRKESRRVASWNYKLETDEKEWFTSLKMDLPKYVLNICRELGAIMARRFPLRGEGVGVESLVVK